MAKIDVIMPQMGESIAEGTLSRWIKKVGDAVKRDEPIFEISTDKVDAEIPAPAAGVLAEILVTGGPDGRGADRRGDGSRPTPAPAASPGRARPRRAAAPRRPSPPRAPRRPPAAGAAPPRPLPRRPRPRPRAASAPTPAPAAARAATDGATAAETAEERLRRRSTPLVRKMAAEHNLDLSAIPGTGLAGRVTKNDMLELPRGGAGQRRGRGGAAAPPRRPAARGASAPAAPLRRAPRVEPWDGDRVEPWSRIRKLTAEHMVMSRRVSPHVNTIFEIDYTRVVAAPRQEEEGVRRPGREPDLSRVHREGRGRRPAQAPRRQRRGVAARAPSSGATSISASRWRSTGASSCR